MLAWFLLLACRVPRFFVRVVASFVVVPCCRSDLDLHLDRVLIGGRDCDVGAVVFQLVDEDVPFGVISLILSICVRCRG